MKSVGGIGEMTMTDQDKVLGNTNLSQYHNVHNKSNTDCPGNKPRPLKPKASDKLLMPLHSHS